MPGPAGASVVVATVGRPERLAELVDTVLADPGTTELLVVVDGPDLRSAARLHALAARRPRLRPLVVSRRGQLGALDEGVRRARCEVVVLLDDDVLPAPGTVAGHLAHHRDHGGLVVAGPMPVATPRGDRAEVATRLYATEYLAHLDALASGGVDPLDVLWTGNLSLRRRHCLAVGLASPGFRAHYHADTDLGFRLAAAGLEGRYDPQLLAHHRHRRDDRAFLRDAARQGEGRAALHRAHPGRMGPWSPR
ncbi:MAG: glycosyltransferase, partial [Acidimicrobiales bacterium]